MTIDDCRGLLERMTGGAVPFDAGLLRPSTPREVLARMLRNLKAIHLRQGDVPAALAAVERIVLLLPDDVDERRDQGLLRASLRRWGRAVEDLEQYLTLRPTAADAARVREQLDEARRKLWELN
jgi:regulator of sirC expression with transglutaminase-like and TPR domain